MPDSSTRRPGVDRRHALTGAVGVGLALPVLAACGGSDAEPASGSSSGGSGSGGSGGSGPAGTLATADVPVGGCTVLADEKVVVTQPTEGEFKAFTAVCTHQGCVVSSGSDGVIPCGCHGSQFSLADGSVQQGPATAPLDEVEITVKGDQITLA
jgi:nitrite reductase/ring-hydroxylating ferredoxin subunit